MVEQMLTYGIHIAKDVPIAVGSSLELLSGGKYVLQTGDILKIDSNVMEQ